MTAKAAYTLKERMLMYLAISIPLILFFVIAGAMIGEDREVQARCAVWDASYKHRPDQVSNCPYRMYDRSRYEPR